MIYINFLTEENFLYGCPTITKDGEDMVLFRAHYWIFVSELIFTTKRLPLTPSQCLAGVWSAFSGNKVTEANRISVFKPYGR